MKSHKGLWVISLLTVICGLILSGFSNTQTKLELGSLGETTQFSYVTDNPNIRQVITSPTSISFTLKTPPILIKDRIVDGKACQSITADGVATKSESGGLTLPVQGVMIGIPLDANPELRIISINTEVIENSIDLCPTEVPIVGRDKAGLLVQKGLQYEYNLQNQVNQSLLPSDVAGISSIGFLRQQRYVQLQINPVQISQGKGIVQYHPSIEIQLIFNSEYKNEVDETSFSPDKYFEPVYESTLLNYQQAKQWRKLALPVNMFQGETEEQQAYYKILVNQDRVYKLDYTYLANAGLPLETIDPRKIHITNRGVEISMYIEGESDGLFDPDDFILFYGERVKSKFTATNVYWLSWDENDGSRMNQFDGAPSGSHANPTYFPATIHNEQNLIYLTDISTGLDKDHWYWSASTPFETQFVLQNLSLGEHTATLKGLIGKYTSGTPLITVYLNQGVEPIFSGFLSNLTEYNLEVNFDQSLLVEGTNTFRIETDSNNIIFINWLELTYQDTYIAENDRLKFPFIDPGDWEVNVNGFSQGEIEILDLTNPTHPLMIINGEITSAGSDYSIRFDYAGDGNPVFLAQTLSHRIMPMSIQQDTPSYLRSTENGADYLIITCSDFYSAVQPLKTYRESTGYRVQIVDVQDIYDEFNWGIENPEAIKTFITYAYNNWVQPGVSYVLLFGDGTYDFQNYSSSGDRNFVPPYLDEIDPWIGETSTDNRYANISGDDILPDLFIGRLPARTLADVQLMIEKVIAYEQTPPNSDWTSAITLLADNKDTGGDFPAETDEIIQTIPDTYVIQKIYYGVNYTSPTLVRTDMVAAINAGRLLIHYAGHGSIQYWAAEKLLRFTEVYAFSNGNKLPVFLPMTCMEGYFIYPNYSSMAEIVMRKTNGGAIASWSPTGFGLTDGHTLLETSFVRNLLLHHYTNIGFLTTQAKYDLFVQTGTYRDLIETYMLFGDPALSIQIPPTPLEAPTSLQIAETGSTYIDLTWTDNSAGETEFRVERSNNGTDNWRTVATLPENTTYYHDSNLPSGVMYYYRIVGFRISDGALSEYSNVVNAATTELSTLFLPQVFR